MALGYFFDVVCPHSTREEALRLWVQGVPTVATADEVLFYGAAAPARLRAMLVKESGARRGPVV